jgi:hypothetical protein
MARTVDLIIPPKTTVPISCEDFFEKFDEENLAMVYQEENADGETSYFCKFVAREK